MKKAPDPFLLDCPGASHRVAFGLRWLVLIGSDTQALARARGRRLRATHAVVGGSPATMAGYGRLRAGWRGRLRDRMAGRAGKPPILAAAQLYALRFASGGHCLVPLPDGRHWLAAAQDGVVLSQADRIFTSRTEALQAQARLQEQRPALPEHDADAVWAVLMRAADPAARLATLPSRWASVPFALRLFLLCLGLSALAPPIWRATAPYRASSSAAIHAGRPELPERNAAHRAMLGTLAAHRPDEISRLLRSVGMLPIHVQGWALRRAQCDAGGGAWRCAAVYARATSLATNQQLYERLPAGWQVSFKPLDEATLAWRVASPSISLAQLVLPNALRVDTELVGALQRVRPAFASVMLAPAVVVPTSAHAAGAALAPAVVPTSSPASPSQPVSPSSPASQLPSRSAPGSPRTDKNSAPGSARVDGGAVLPQDVAHVLRRRALRLQGPLRSLALLPSALAPARWSRLVVDVKAQPKPNLVASTLVAELQGELYEQD